MTTMDSDGKIVHIKGDTLYIKLQNIKNDGVTVDWTGYTVKFVVKTAPGGKIILTLTQAAGDGIDITTNGTMIIQKAAADMALIPARSYVYDIQVTKAGVVDTWFNNLPFIVTEEVAS